MTGQMKRCPGACGATIAERVLSCPACWIRLPQAMQTAVITTQQDRRLAPTDPTAVAEHRAAASAARSWLRLHPQPRPRLVTADLSAEVAASMTTGEQARCKACSAPIVWATTSSGDRVPVDVEPIDASTGSANVKLTARGEGHPPRAERVRDQRVFFGVRYGWRDHMTTCPFADYYRTRARRRSS